MGDKYEKKIESHNDKHTAISLFVYTYLVISQESAVGFCYCCYCIYSTASVTTIYIM